MMLLGLFSMLSAGGGVEGSKKIRVSFVFGFKTDFAANQNSRIEKKLPLTVFSHFGFVHKLRNSKNESILVFFNFRFI